MFHVKHFLYELSGKRWCEMTYFEKIVLIAICLIFALSASFNGIAL